MSTDASDQLLLNQSLGSEFQIPAKLASKLTSEQDERLRKLVLEQERARKAQHYDNDRSSEGSEDDEDDDDDGVDDDDDDQDNVEGENDEVNNDQQIDDDEQPKN